MAVAVVDMQPLQSLDKYDKGMRLLATILDTLVVVLLFVHPLTE